MTQVSALQLALLKPSSMNGLTRTSFLMDQPLQRIAIHYMHQPNVQVSLIHMEPSHAGGVKVVIILEMADF